MSSKTIHSLAGLAVAITLTAIYQPAWWQALALLAGTHLGASAPDWMEVPVWTRRWSMFGGDAVRHSLIPHRTITHTFSLWIAAFAGLGHVVSGLGSPVLTMLTVGFCAAVASHLLLDITTPMGIPMTPFGPRYRLRGLSLQRAQS